MGLLVEIIFLLKLIILESIRLALYLQMILKLCPTGIKEKKTMFI